MLYILGGDKVLAELLSGEKLYILIITEMELLSFRDITANEESQIKSFLKDFTTVNISDDIRDEAIESKRTLT